MSRKNRVWWVLGAAFAVRILGMLVSGSHLHPDEVEMGVIARNILSGDGFSLAFLAPERPTAAFPPFESYFYALVHRLFGFTTAAYVVLITIRSACSVLTSYVVYRMVRRELSEPLAFLALVTTSFYPAFIYYASISSYMVRSPLSTLAVVGAVASLLWLVRKPTAGRTIATGAVFGLGCLVQSNLLALTPLAWFWLAGSLWLDRSAGARRSRWALLLLLPVTVMLVIAPWTARNYRVLGEPVLVRSGFGTLFWIGNNPVSQGDLAHIGHLPNPEFDIEPASTLSPELLARVRSSTELERDRILLGESRKFIAAHPERYLELTMNRLRLFMFGPTKPRSSTRMKLVDGAFKGTSALLFALAFAAPFLRRDRVVWLFVLVVASFALLYGLTQMGHYYYRMDSEPFSLILALLTLQCLWKSRSRLQTQSATTTSRNAGAIPAAPAGPLG